MKAKVYLRVARGPRGPKVAATITPNYAPLMVGSPGYNERALPTVAFAIALDIPEEVLAHAEQVIAELEVPAERALIAAVVEEEA